MIIKAIGYAASEMVPDRNADPVRSGKGGGAAQQLTERATLSTDTASVKSLVAKAMGGPEIRQAKVENVKANLREGSYAMDASLTASAILADQT